MHSIMPIVRMIAWIMLTWICNDIVSSGVFMGRAIEAHAQELKVPSHNLKLHD